MDRPLTRWNPVKCVLGGLVLWGCCITGQARAQAPSSGQGSQPAKEKAAVKGKGKASQSPKSALRGAAAALPAAPPARQAAPLRPAVRQSPARLIRNRCVRRLNGGASAARGGNKTPPPPLRPSVRLFHGRCHRP